MYTSTILYNYIVYYTLYSTLVLHYCTVHIYYMLQVANYMNGGHYNPHTDYVMREKVPDHVRSICYCYIALSSTTLIVSL